jgi:hypothetical protein
MASWLQHPRYVPIRDALIQYLKADRRRFRRLDPILFLCGADASPRRDNLRDYLQKFHPNLRIFYAEKVWEEIATSTDRDALGMEAELAALADSIIVIVESPGTFAELGAFSNSEPLRQKLLPIVGEQHRDSNSFISTGPLRWIDKDSRFRPTIYTQLSQILNAAGDVEQRLSRIERARSLRIEDLASSPKHLLFFMCDLVSVIHPATIASIQYYIHAISPTVEGSTIHIPTLIGLAVAMRLLRRVNVPTDGNIAVYYCPFGVESVGRPYHHRRLLDLQSQRAAHVSVLQTIPASIAALRATRDAR